MEVDVMWAKDQGENIMGEARIDDVIIPICVPKSEIKNAHELRVWVAIKYKEEYREELIGKGEVDD